MSQQRLNLLHSHLKIPDLPSFDRLPNFKNFTGCAWEVWGKGDQLGTVNLLTDEVVQKAASEEIRTGKSICLNWPINFPSKPIFHRQAPEISVKSLFGENVPLNDDILHMNTQSGSQWDGLRHFGVIEHGVFYQGIPATDIKAGRYEFHNPLDVNQDQIKLGIHNWAQHGISGRGVLLDINTYTSKKNGGKLPYDPLNTTGFSPALLEEVARAQGVTFRPADILILRVGFTQAYNEMTQDSKDALVKKEETLAGIEQSEDMKRFLWNNHFAAIASDQPAIESWPPKEGVPHMHQTLLGMWGMPIGEFFDVERLAEHCAKTGRYTFFFSSWPMNTLIFESSQIYGRISVTTTKEDMKKLNRIQGIKLDYKACF